MTQVAPAPQQQAAVAFIDGTYEYREIIRTDTVTPGAASQELQAINITPGGFLRGVTLLVSTTGGTLGTGVIDPDAPFSLINSITMESIDGTPILYPKSGYSEYLVSRFTHPWFGDPALDPSFSATINPAFRLSYFVEARATLGCLPNTDARAQYRIRCTIAPLAALLSTVGSATAGVSTLVWLVEQYAQPPRATLGGAPIEPVPAGIGVQRFTSHQFDNSNTGTFQIKENRTGNLIRTIILVVRATGGNLPRTDLTAEPIRLRVDNTQLFVETRAARDYDMLRAYSTGLGLPAAGMTRPTGVYVWQRWQDPGDLIGVGWLETTEATFLQFELNGGPAGGQVESLIEDIAPVTGVPATLENI